MTMRISTQSFFEDSDSKNVLYQRHYLQSGNNPDSVSQYSAKVYLLLSSYHSLGCTCYWHSCPIERHYYKLEFSPLDPWLCSLCVDLVPFVNFQSTVLIELLFFIENEYGQIV